MIKLKDMKKLLLCIITVLLFLGISFWWTYIFNWPAITDAVNIQATDNNRQYTFFIQSDMTLVSFITPNAAGYQCKWYTGMKYNLYRITNPNTSTWVSSWTFTGFDWTTSISVNKFLTGQNWYTINFTALVTRSCACTYNAWNWRNYTSGFFTQLWGYSMTTVCGFGSITFSWTRPVPTTTYIRYNGTSTITTDTNIYLQWLFNYSLSGSSTVFTYNPFRSLLRRH